MNATLEAIASTTDEEFCRLLGVDLDWTKFVADTLHKRGERDKNGTFDDMVTDIVTDLLMALHGDNQLADKIEMCRATAVDDEALMNMVKPVMSSAVHLRFRDFRRRDSHNIGHQEMVEGAPEPMDSQPYIGCELDAEGMKEMIAAELVKRRDNANGMQRTALDKAMVMLPDRIEGMGLRAICEKHGWGRGKMASLALKEIFNAVEAVATRLQDGWMMALISK